MPRTERLEGQAYSDLHPVYVLQRYCLGNERWGCYCHSASHLGLSVWSTNSKADSVNGTRLWSCTIFFLFHSRMNMLIQYFSQADQCLCEWRCAFGSAALMIVNTFFLASELNTNEERQKLSDRAA
jgi:hypothetical protein